MSFSQEWDQLYKKNAHMSIWPWSDLIAYVMRYARPCAVNCRVLELGCGAGANIPFFQSLGVRYHSIEGSATIVRTVRERFPEYAGTIMVGDFTKSIPFEGQFDMIIDRSALPHNPTGAIRQTLERLYDVLKPGGYYIGIDWFSTEFTEFAYGEPSGDDYTRHNLTSGKLAETGVVHFSDKQHLLELFHEFIFVVLEHKKVFREIPADAYVLASWNFVAMKPAQ
jgi:SAM-dependent methyltransferase